MSNILIVDDHAVVRQAIRLAFKFVRGLVLREAVDGRDAIQKAKELRPDAVILDMSMPVLNGLETARILKNLMPAVPLFMLTAHVSPQLRVAAQKSGIANVFSKNQGLSALVSAVETNFPLAQTQM
jgi:DNA-binding NarL/FixJ family response regulator